jgi:hypothetical protein
MSLIFMFNINSSINGINYQKKKKKKKKKKFKNVIKLITIIACIENKPIN